MHSLYDLYKHFLKPHKLYGAHSQNYLQLIAFYALPCVICVGI